MEPSEMVGRAKEMVAGSFGVDVSVCISTSIYDEETGEVTVTLVTPDGQTHGPETVRPQS